MYEFEKIENKDFQWGGLYMPAKARPGNAGGLRLAVFGSTNAGNLVIRTLLKYENKYPGRINVVGVATDDPIDPNTRISVAKRIWGRYSPDEMIALRDKVINTCMEAGVPCYTGGVKNNLFRDIFCEWAPELVIMCCFGQKINRQIYDHPVYGMYNFHPSDLAAQIGAGPKPFEGTMQNGKSTSRMVIHQVNEIIDGGPLVASSPPVNICLPNGSYPENILSLQEKIPAISGWMSMELVLEVLKMKDMNETGRLGFQNLESRIPEKIRSKLMEPVTNDLIEMYSLPDHDCLI
ncbi:MAG: formyltransferase family protein [Bacteroidetes bacterium]|nr:formyltransferase family protein [Bacteroidota bacterium]